ncbi:cytoplasmic tRNA 2-thiolation protein 2 [Apium graveolens]|uniref:cytoplasmic tRNA 2-thiolation protein 2 n=1 Tax=Apium graveolens TaxID=4045 RepID=UPI003D7B5F3E
MDCNGTGGCESGCYKEENESTNGALPSVTNNPFSNLCLKCKSSEIIAGAVNGGNNMKLCGECFRGNLYGKFKFAVTANAMISPSDNVLVAFSGGTSSRVALQFVHEMQVKSQKNFDASRDRSLPVFGVGVAFVNESAFHRSPSIELDKEIEAMKLIVDELSPPTKAFHVIPIESICSSNSNSARDNLNELLSVVSDKTGKEDLLIQLRMLSLQKTALENRYTKLVLGSCTSRIACHVIASTVKGQGYSLAADIQYVDARLEIPVVYPLRDCTLQELNMLCKLDSLKTLELYNGSRAGINGLISSFVKLLQEENPSRECTIVRTAAKLSPFHFNKIPEEADDCNLQLASQRRRKKFNLKSNELLPPKSYCPICSSPLDKNSISSFTFENTHTSHESFGSKCCSSCQFQILPKETLQMEHFYSLLPQSITDRAKDGYCHNQRSIREQIQDCLLSDNEDGT